MNEKPAPAMVDVQNLADTRQIAINRVGIKAIRHPVKVLDRSGGIQHTIAVFNMYVGLPHNFKGTHMSRFVEILNSHERAISVENFPAMLQDPVDVLSARATGVAAWELVGTQVLWVLALTVLARVVLAAGTRRLVVQGG